MPSPTVSRRTVVREPPRFVEVQRFVPRALSLSLLVGLAAVAAWALAVAPATGPQIGPPLVVGLVLVVLFHLLELTVTVRSSEVDVHFRPIRRRRIAIGDVLTCRARDYRPIREFGGWGIHRGWKGTWAYNVRGHRGVELTLRDGGSLMIGSQRADELAQAIRECAGLGPGTG
jgi:hypothetical protein